MIILLIMLILIVNSYTDSLVTGLSDSGTWHGDNEFDINMVDHRLSVYDSEAIA